MLVDVERRVAGKKYDGDGCVNGCIDGFYSKPLYLWNSTACGM